MDKRRETNYHKPYPFRTKGDTPPRYCKVDDTIL